MDNFNHIRRYWQFFWQFLGMFSYFPVVATAAVLDVGAAMTAGITKDDIIVIIGDHDGTDFKILKEYQRPFFQISVGYTQTCALYHDKTIHGEGGNLVCVGNGITQKNGTFSQVSVAPFHFCGLHTDGSVECWKGPQKPLINNVPDYGQTTPPDGFFVQVSAGRWHTCALRPDLSVTCWGNNRYHQTVVPNETFSQISAAKFGWHTCGIKTADQTVVCWGLNDHGQATPPPGPFSQVSAGKWYTCGIRADDQTIACWGSNHDGQAIPPSGRFSYVSAGLVHTCAIQADNYAPVCWGYNVFNSVKDVSGDSLPLKRID